jgi:hypothetical protein
MKGQVAQAAGKVVVPLTAAALAACDSDDDGVYTLYRSSPAVQEPLHVATFDAAEGADYNLKNCEIVADLMANQPGVVVDYWSAMGRLNE